MCSAHGGEPGYLAAIGIPPAEILDADRVCLACRLTPSFDGSPIPDHVCHVCGGPGEPGSYWRELVGRELPAEGPVAGVVAMAVAEVGTQGEGELSEAGLREFFDAARILSPASRQVWRRLLESFLASQQFGRRVAEHEAHEKRIKEAEAAGKGGRGG